jgi:CRP-like cAMP-binding protein
MHKLRQYLDSIAPLNEFEWEFAQALFTEVKVVKDECFVKSDESCNKVAFIEKGLFRLYYVLDGEENTTLFFSENQFVTDYYSFLTRTPCIGTIEALEDSVIYIITYSDLQKLYEYKDWERIGRIMAERAFSFSVMEANRFSHDDFETRFVTFFKENPGFIQRIPQYMIASYLKMTPETLCRIKKRVLKNGDIEYKSIHETPKSKFL